MNTEKLCLLANQLGCEVIRNGMLRDFTTFKVGGECPLIIAINSEESLSRLICACADGGMRYMVLAKGSNMLCDDKGFDGVILLMGSAFSQIEMIGDCLVRVNAGCSLMKLCRFALDNSLTGLEFAYGIPGTVGGAVYMNAGAYGGEIKDIAEVVHAVDGSGRSREFKRDELGLSYRGSVFQKNGCIITSAVFRLEKGDREQISAKMEQLMSRRREKQLEFPNAGSTFKRPAGQFAGKLIQDCGLRGLTVGGAQVSKKHCGFVINTGNATSEDIKTLIKQVQDTVLEKTGFFLECEVRIIPYSDTNT